MISIFLCLVRKGWTYIEKSLNDGKAYVDEAGQGDSWR